MTHTTPTLRARVDRRIARGQDVVVLELVSVSGAALPAFEAGAHIDVHVGDGKGGEIVRQYSLCGDPADRMRYRIGVLRDRASRGGSIAVHETLKEGVELTISAPRNHFPLTTGDSGKAYLFGGGIGVTPMIAMAHTLHQLGQDFELHYSSHAPAQAAFLDELKASPFATRVSLHFSEGGPPGRADATRILASAPPGAHVYTCGPTGYMDWVMDAARNLGFPSGRIHFEYFQVEVKTGGDSFTVVAQASGKEVVVDPEETITSALERIGIRIQVSCEQGICGTCMCTVLEGTPDHRDSYQTDEEKEANDQITVCCSRSLTSKLVLDL